MGEMLEIVFGVILGFILGREFACGGRIKLAQPDFFTRFGAKLLAVVQSFEPPVGRERGAM
jgi:hypothetical protein